MEKVLQIIIPQNTSNSLDNYCKLHSCGNPRDRFPSGEFKPYCNMPRLCTATYSFQEVTQEQLGSLERGLRSEGFL